MARTLRSHAIDSANADTQFAVATLDQIPTAQADHDAAIQLADDSSAKMLAYVTDMAGAARDYHVGMSQATHDLLDAGEQTTYDSTIKTLLTDYRDTDGQKTSTYDVDLAAIDQRYTDLIHGAGDTQLGTPSATTARETAYSSSLRSFETTEATSNAAMLATLTRLRLWDSSTGTPGWEVEEQQTHSAAMAVFAASSPSPWSTQLSGEYSAESTRDTSVAQEESIREIAVSTAAKDLAVAECTEQEAQSSALAAADAQLFSTQAQAFADQAEAEQNADPGAATNREPFALRAGEPRARAGDISAPKDSSGNKLPD